MFPSWTTDDNILCILDVIVGPFNLGLNKDKFTWGGFEPTTDNLRINLPALYQLSSYIGNLPI